MNRSTSNVQLAGPPAQPAWWRDPGVLRVVWVNVILHGLLLIGCLVAWSQGLFTSAFTVGLLATAYTLGLRHAFDPDHIAAIDNTTRALQNDARTPQSIGMFFALGHSTVVIIAAGLIAASARWANLTEDSPLTQALGIWGATFSGVVLLVLALINLSKLRVMLQTERQFRATGRPVDASTTQSAAHESLTSNQLPSGPLGRILGPMVRRVSKPWHMYPVGFLFGLGFDTATEISLLILAASGVALGVPWWTMMLLPLAFTAGMAAMDSADGIFMARAYRWALDRPEMKLRYNIVMTTISVVFALFIGITGLLFLADELGFTPLSWVNNLELDNSGYWILVIFIAIYAASRIRWNVRTRRLSSGLRRG
ncbi:HoxN/HupN/NixA family nickel/cobalt transporter [Corynebacterium falsenii]|uniref:HoxN/HupN/NixA family nickel/cobalt transporter n=1 Tax=Corynebacterium falsenii TaxID=108486 RepID=UPI001D7FCE6A|nr:HoxN/HupN/NixA family nickel/cobalt transporter [Corynebacterium falsenii]HJF13140.1 HoxN/HupN/NixA family nickel/cobalt transporter [Corynebacterium falsenii]